MQVFALQLTSCATLEEAVSAQLWACSLKAEVEVLAHDELEIIHVNMFQEHFQAYTGAQIMSADADSLVFSVLVLKALLAASPFPLVSGPLFSEESVSKLQSPHCSATPSFLGKGFGEAERAIIYF